MNEKDEFKLKWDYFQFNPIYKKTEKIKQQFDKIFKVAKIKISEFEQKHNIETIVFFNHNSNELSLYSCDPDNYETTMKFHQFLDELNHHLKHDLQYPLID